MWQEYTQAFKDILAYFKKHVKEEYHPGYYASFVVIVIATIAANYLLFPKHTVETWITNNYYGRELCILIYLVFYGIPYYLVLGLYAWFHKENQVFKSREFWVKSLLGLLLLSVDASFYYYRYAGNLASYSGEAYVFRKIAGTFISFIVIWIPLLIFKKWRDKKQPSLYGLSWKGFNYRPYLLMLLIMVPVVLAASFTQDFIDYYPTLKPRNAGLLKTIPIWLTMTIYEFFYLVDFLWTELIFRGFLVIGMAAVLGRGAVLPMVIIYAFRHFAKPLGETIGSVFGGYILGVIALRSKNIMGGVMIHMGIAFLMEIFAIFHYIFR
ncbi:MAG: CPBP family intramembrane glutamic endopeptidase [Bacteroidia bacterium]